ncbi:T-cell ecto-ADP-ribosyltransferase 1 [Lampris incognitus]|uniref:T-cell ecto-ADP-ribosyltransferase 1 n=1 Tax=Lampris incognitus TaxID=2546036 RepID=UPI0024B4BF19|nr:T-cell ecto-ADP-ribosyltransferase 1 [Lampris incognitus]
MHHKGERILAVFFATVLYCKAVVASKELGMVPNAVDDQYIGCRDKVLKDVTQNLLNKELSNSEAFKTTWVTKRLCQSLIRGGVEEHTTALLAYTHSSPYFRKSFNNDVETMGENATIYASNFHFKSFHFLLMDSMNLLNKGKCQTLYHLSATKYNAKLGAEIRFGRFTEAQQDNMDLLEDPDIEDGTLFNITSCSVLSVKENICNQGQIGMLLSPAEVFTVEEVKAHNNDGYRYTEIVLKHKKMFSYHNCYLSSWSTTTGSCTLNLASNVLVTIVVSFSVFTS